MADGGDAAIDALFLSDIASKVLVVSNERESDIEGALMDRLRNKLNIEILKGQVTNIVGFQVVKAIKILDYSTQREVEKSVNGVFVSLGGVPMTAIVKKRWSSY